MTWFSQGPVHCWIKGPTVLALTYAGNAVGGLYLIRSLMQGYGDRPSTATCIQQCKIGAHN